MQILSPAKINIGLHITSKRPDGYHNLETIFYPIPLYDTLEVKIIDSPQCPYCFTSHGISIPGASEKNLVISVFQQMQHEFSLPPLDITLHKKIPVGAGLGGGSSDAASMMIILNHMFQLGLSDNEMETRIASFGADCHSFIRKNPVYATGIGNIFQTAEIDLNGYYLILVKPQIHVSTAQAYAFVKAHPADIDLRDATKLPISQWKRCIKNDFEESVFSQFPHIAAIKQKLYDLGAEYVSMSGSGSSVFGLFKQAIPLLHKQFIDCFTFQAPLLK